MPNAPNVPGGGAVLTDATFDVTQAAPIASSTGWTRAARAALNNEGLVKFREGFIKKVIKTPISSNLNVTSYKASEMEDKSNFFYAIATWTNSSLQFQSWMRTHFVDTVFVIMRMVTTETTSAGGTITTTNTVTQVDNLFKIWNTVTLDEVYDSCDIYFKFAANAVEAQNLNLSWEFIMVNIDSDLRAVVNAELSSYVERNPQVAQTGPMAFHIIANRIIRCTTGLSHHVVTGMMGMGLIHYKGENVVDCVATLRNVLLFLGHGTPRSQCPPTLMKILVEVFLRCSNPVFISYVRNLADFHEGDIDTPEKLFSRAQMYYNELLMKPNGWLKVTKNRAAFSAELPELMAVMDTQGAFNDPLATGVPTEIDVPTPRRPRRNRAPPADAHVAGTPPTGTPGQRDAQGRYTHDRQGNPIDRNAPADGQPTSRRKSDGTTEYWCSQSDRWGNHDDNHHEAFKARQQRNRNRRNNNNNDNGGGGNEQPPSMHRATFAQPILSLLSGRFNTAYDTDGSF